MPVALSKIKNKTKHILLLNKEVKKIFNFMDMAPGLYLYTYVFMHVSGEKSDRWWKEIHDLFRR